MKALVLKENKALNIEEIDVPVLAENQALVAIQYAALNHRDEWIRQGQYAKIKLPAVLGSDGAGVVEQVGNNKNQAWLGKKVIINPNQNWGNNNAFQDKDYTILGMPSQGTLAQYIAVGIDRLHEIPAYLNMEQATALPLAGLTAYNALMNKGKATSKDKILISGVGGGVAQFAFLFAVAIGAEVYITSSKKTVLEQCKAMGAKDGCLYTDRENLLLMAKAIGGFNLIVDSACGDGMNDLLACLQPSGKFVFYGATKGLPTNLNMRTIFWNHLQLLGSTMGSDDDFKQMLQFVNQYQIQPIIDKIFDLEKATNAFDRMHKGEQFGKIIVKIN